MADSVQDSLEKIFSNYCLCFSQNQKRGTNVGVNAAQAPLRGSTNSFCIDTPKQARTVNCSLDGNKKKKSSIKEDIQH